MQEKTESVTHIASSCSVLANSQYEKKNDDKVGKRIHWLLLQVKIRFYRYIAQTRSTIILRIAKSLSF